LRSATSGLSGAEIGRRIGVSRAAVWKHVAHLRARGYRIEGTPSRGYRLLETPDRLGPVELGRVLTSKVLGRVVHYQETVDSTNRIARDLARAGAPHGAVIIADSQTAGRGRLGRSWFSPPGANLYLSVVLRPEVPPARAPQLALVAATAVAKTVEVVGGVRPEIKWPNDVLLEGRKVAGILAELDSEADRVTVVIVGIGVNLNVSERDLEVALHCPATAVAAATGASVDRAAFAARLLIELEERYCRYVAHGFGGLREEWESYSCLTGRRVTVAGPEGQQCGRVLGVDADGALRLRGSRGTTVRVLAGDVTVSGGWRRGHRRRDRNGGR
jgi:BirA family biotin operon repressor/biotin-[acetyl-CoA-carboxylase] ligase